MPFKQHRSMVTDRPRPPPVVTGVATQGRNSTLEHMWVETFELAFSKDGKTWDTYKENNITKVGWKCALTKF